MPDESHAGAVDTVSYVPTCSSRLNFSTAGLPPCQLLLNSEMTSLSDVQAKSTFLAPLEELYGDAIVREKVEEAGRLFFSNSFFTIDLFPYLIIPGLILLGLLLFGFLGTDDDYGSSGSSGYGLLSKSYNYEDTLADLQAQVASLQESQAALSESYGGYGAYDTGSPDVSYGS